MNTFVNYLIVYYQDIYRTFHYSILLGYLQDISLQYIRDISLQYIIRIFTGHFILQRIFTGNIIRIITVNY